MNNWIRIGESEDQNCFIKISSIISVINATKTKAIIYPLWVKVRIYLLGDIDYTVAYLDYRTIEEWEVIISEWEMASE